MSKHSKRRETREAADKDSNGFANLTQSLNQKTSSSLSKQKSAEPTPSPSGGKVEDWPTLGETVGRNYMSSKDSVDKEQDMEDAVDTCWKRLSLQKISHIVEQTNDSGENNSKEKSDKLNNNDLDDQDQVCSADASDGINNGAESCEDAGKSRDIKVTSSNCDQAAKDSSPEDASASLPDKQASGGAENLSAANSRKKGSKHRWRPLVIEPQTTKQQERRRGQRNPRRRGPSVSSADTAEPRRFDDYENRSKPPDKSYRGSRRGRGRGYGSYQRQQYNNSRPRSYEAEKVSAQVSLHEEYPPNLAYYVDYEHVTLSDGLAVATHAGIKAPLTAPPALTRLPANSLAGTITATPFVPSYYPFAAVSPMSGEALNKCIRNQVEYYFSEENLQRDFFIRRKMDADGYLPINLIASFKRVQALTQDLIVLIDALRLSAEVELSSDNTKVRTKREPQKWPITDSRAVNANSYNINNNEEKLQASSESSSEHCVVPSSYLHPDVPDFIPGQPYGYGYDGAPSLGSFQKGTKPAVVIPNPTCTSSDSSEIESISVKVSCYADAVKSSRKDESNAGMFENAHHVGDPSEKEAPPSKASLRAESD